MNMFNGCFRAHQNHCTVHPHLHYTVLYCTVLCTVYLYSIYCVCSSLLCWRERGKEGRSRCRCTV